MFSRKRRKKKKDNKEIAKNRLKSIVTQDRKEYQKHLSATRCQEK